MTNILKIADYLAERIDNAPQGDIFTQKSMELSVLKELLENRIEKLEHGDIYSESLRKINRENEIIFLKNILKRLSE